MKVKKSSRHAVLPVIPRKYSGQWVAWDRSRTRIVAQERSFREEFEATRVADRRDVAYMKVPEVDVRFVGSTP
jgi:hypothetical protein